MNLSTQKNPTDIKNQFADLPKITKSLRDRAKILNLRATIILIIIGLFISAGISIFLFAGKIAKLETSTYSQADTDETQDILFLPTASLIESK